MQKREIKARAAGEAAKAITHDQPIELINPVLEVSGHSTGTLYINGEPCVEVTWSGSDDWQPFWYDGVKYEINVWFDEELMASIYPGGRVSTASDNSIPVTINTQESNTITLSWHIDDVTNERPDLTPAQCREVLRHVKDKHDASIGVNWDVIRETANFLYPQK